MIMSRPQSRNSLGSCLAALVAASACGGTAVAGIVVDVQQAGSDVTMTYSFTSWNVVGNNINGGQVGAGNQVLGGTQQYGSVIIGSNTTGNVSTRQFALGTLTSSPSGSSGQFGTASISSYTNATTSTVNVAMVNLKTGATNANVYLDDAFWNSGNITGSITGVMTFANTTMATLGFTNYGTFVWTFGTTSTDTFTVNLIGASAVPGSGLAAVGSLGLAGLARRRRR